MAVTTNRGVVATDDPLSNDLAVSMDTQVANQDVNTTQFSSMLMKLPVTTSKSFKEEWMEDVYLPKNTALSATAASADTNLAVTTSEGNYGKVGDIGKFVQTGEAFRITATGASAWTVVRAIGTVAAATAASGTTQGGLVIVNGSNEQDGGLPTALVTSKTANYNYHQIIRNAYTFTNTAQWTNWYSGNPLTYHRKKIAVEHKRELENGLFFGARSYTAGTSTPRATFGGLDEFISTNITDAGGTFDKGELQDFLRGGMEFGDPTKKVLFAAPIVAQVLSEFLQDNWVHATTDDNIFGIKVDFVISGVTGSRIPVFVKNDWKRYGEGSALHIGSRAYLVDLSNVELHKAPSTQSGSRYATLYSNRQSPDVDYVSEEFLSDITFIPKLEKAHALLKAVTG
jgi:hypothetical protein